MTRRSAEALCPSALVLARDPATEAIRFEPLLDAIEDLIPRVEVVEPGWVFVPIDGAVRYYGGERALVDRIAATLERLRPEGISEWLTVRSPPTGQPDLATRR